ncbi:MAG: hypothetical protein RXR20_09390, partial [Paraburkholderia sp.]
MGSGVLGSKVGTEDCITRFPDAELVKGSVQYAANDRDLGTREIAAGDPAKDRLAVEQRNREVLRFPCPIAVPVWFL